MKKSKLTAYKTAALCAALTALGIVMSLLESEAMVFSVFFGLLTIAEAVHQTRVLWMRYKAAKMQKMNLKANSISDRISV